MNLFEILFLALFILFPVMEQLMRRKRAEAEEPDSDELGPDPMEPGPGEVSPRSSEREPIQASEMVPDDLWAILTGETRHTEGVEREEEQEEPWSAPNPAPDPIPTPDEVPSPTPAVASMETPVDSAEARHRRFHDIIDRPVPRRPARRSRTLRALRSPESVRQAFVLSEVLGRPKSLE